jgi:hypothetical protein
MGLACAPASVKNLMVDCVESVPDAGIYKSVSERFNVPLLCTLWYLIQQLI